MSEKDLKAKEYSKIKMKMTVIGIGLSLVVLSLMSFSGLNFFLRDLVLGLNFSFFVSHFIFYILFFIFFLFFELPLNFYSGYTLEHRYDLSNQTAKKWIWEQFKKQALSCLFGALLFVGFYWILQTFENNWWLVAWGMWILISIVFGQLWPVLILPLFYKTSEMTDIRLRDRLTQFIEEREVKVSKVLSINFSKNTKKANAVFCGLGRTKRVLLGDTLLESFTPDEIEVVLAHELGHCKRQHIVKNLVFSVFLSFLLFFSYSIVVEELMLWGGYQGVADMAMFPLIMLLAYLLGFVLMPMQNAISRMMEREADDYALDETRDYVTFESTMKKLASQNLADPDPHPFVEWFFYSHPSIPRRIERQMIRRESLGIAL